MSKRNPFDKRREIFRNLLTSARKNKGITQAQLAIRLRQPQSFISKYENGDRSIDLVETYQICQALNYSFVELTSDFEAAINNPFTHYGSVF